MFVLGNMIITEQKKLNKNGSVMNYLRTINKVAGIILLLLVMPVSANDLEERYRQAGHPATTASMFKELSFDNDVSIRMRVASNRKTPKDILRRLATDPNQSVKIAVATNLSADDDVFVILAKDSMQAVRSVVARFEYVPVAALKILAKDNDVDIRLEVARNLNSSKEILFELNHDPDHSVRVLAEQALQRLNDDEKQQ